MRRNTSATPLGSSALCGSIQNRVPMESDAHRPLLSRVDWRTAVWVHFGERLAGAESRTTYPLTEHIKKGKSPNFERTEFSEL